MKDVIFIDFGQKVRLFLGLAFHFMEGYEHRQHRLGHLRLLLCDNLFSIFFFLFFIFFKAVFIILDFAGLVINIVFESYRLH